MSEEFQCQKCGEMNFRHPYRNCDEAEDGLFQAPPSAVNQEALNQRAFYNKVCQKLSGAKHIFHKGVMTPEEWVRQGRPHVWKLVEVNGDAEAWIDTGYGKQALCVAGELEVSHGTQFPFIVNEVVMLSKEYFGTHKYLWR